MCVIKSMSSAKEVLSYPPAAMATSRSKVRSETFGIPLIANKPIFQSGRTHIFQILEKRDRGMGSSDHNIWPSFTSSIGLSIVPLTAITCLSEEMGEIQR